MKQSIWLGSRDVDVESEVDTRPRPRDAVRRRRRCPRLPCTRARAGRGCARRPARPVGGHRSLVDRHAQRHPPEVSRRRRLGRVQVAVRVDPDDRERRSFGGEPADRADVGAAAPAKDERTRRQARWRPRRSARRASTPRRRRSPGIGTASRAAATIASPPSPRPGRRGRDRQRRSRRRRGTRSRRRRRPPCRSGSRGSGARSDAQRCVSQTSNDQPIVIPARS